MDYGAKIAKDGKAVTSTDPADYEFWSKYKSLSLYSKVTTSISLPAGYTSATSTITHNLGYYPYVWAFANDCGNRYCRLPYGIYLCSDCDTKTTVPYFRLTYKITTTTIVLMINAYCWNGSSGAAFGTTYTFDPVDVFIFSQKIK